jgi:hypothetical protein
MSEVGQVEDPLRNEIWHLSPDVVTVLQSEVDQSSLYSTPSQEIFKDTLRSGVGKGVRFSVESI